MDWNQKCISLFRKIANNKDSSKGKEVNISIDSNERKDILFQMKIIRHKMKGIQSKEHKIGKY